MKKSTLFLLALLLWGAFACTTPAEEYPPIEEVPEVKASFTSFQLLKANNGDALRADLAFSIGEGRVEGYSPMIRTLESLVATFTTDGVEVYVGDTKQVSGQTANDFTAPVTYRIISSSGRASECVVDLSGSILPVVIINTPGKAIIPPKTEDWLEGAELRIELPDGTVDYEAEINIRGRGNSTWGFPKKPYALKLNEKASILGMPKHKRWVLLANWLDRTSLRNHIAFHIARQTGLEWTPRGEFVEVILNGKHKGCYYLCEQIKVDENRVNVAELTDSDPSGGYLMELDVYFDEAYKFYSPRCGMPYMFKDPDEVTDAQVDYMYNYVSALEEVLCDQARLEAGEYADYLDVDSFIDWWLVHELTGNSEPYHPKSSYMHKDRGGLLKAGPVWDFDWETFVPYKSGGFVVSGAIYYGYLFKDDAFVARVKERWALLKPALEGVGEFISSEADRIAPAVEENIRLWPIDVTVNQDEQLSFADAVRRMRTSYENKLRWLGKQIEGM